MARWPRSNAPQAATPAYGTPALSTLAVLALGATAIAFAPIFAVLARRYDALEPSVTAFWRTALAAPIMGALLALQPRRSAPRQGTPWPLLLPGVFFAADLGFWHASMTYISAGLATLLSNLSVVLVPVLGWLVFRDRYDRAFLPATVIALLGTLLVCTVPDETTRHTLGVTGENYALGNLLASSTAVAYAAYQLSVQRARRRHGVLAIMCCSSAVSAVLLLTHSLLTGARVLPADARAWTALAALTLISHCFGQGLIAWSLGRLPAFVVALVLLWQPACATLLSVVVLGQGISPLQLAGTLLVLLGLALVAFAKRPRSLHNRDGAGDPRR